MIFRKQILSYRFIGVLPFYGTPIFFGHSKALTFPSQGLLFFNEGLLPHPHFVLFLYVYLLAVRTPRLQLLEEVIALVVDEDEGWEVLYGNLPDGLHAKLRILYTLDALD